MSLWGTILLISSVFFAGFFTAIVWLACWRPAPPADQAKLNEIYNKVQAGKDKVQKAVDVNK